MVIHDMTNKSLVTKQNRRRRIELSSTAQEVFEHLYDSQNAKRLVREYESLVTGKSRKSRRELSSTTQEVFEHLYGACDSQSAKRLVKILDLFSAAEEFRAAIEAMSTVRGLSTRVAPGINGSLIPAASIPGDDLQSLVRAFQESVEQLNSLLSRYKWSPLVRPYYRNLFPSTHFSARNDMEHWENWAVWWLLDDEMGAQIFQLRRCAHCKKWFYPPTTKAIYCRDGCRVGAYNKTPEGKAKHAMTQKIYRDHLREREEAQLDQQKIQLPRTRRRASSRPK
jgi:hypothetical protein